ncbi:MAG: hypothetical protein RL685_3326 [Pseudomonadota bacterium]
MSHIPYPQHKTFELWVRDTGDLDSFAVFLNGQLAERVSDQRKTHKFKIDRPQGSCAVVVHFGGNDSGITAVVDVTNDRERGLAKQTPQDGFRHSYLLEAV